MVGFKVTLDVGLKGIAFVGVVGDGRVEGVGGGFKGVDKGSSGPPRGVKVSVGGGLVAEGSAGAVLASDIRKEAVLLSPDGARFIRGANERGFGGEA